MVTTTANRRWWARPLVWICALYLILAMVYNVQTPLFESADEVWHYPVVQHIQTTGELPVLDPANPLPWRQQAAQPPLYYLLAGLVTAPIDTSDMNEVRRLNPHELGVRYADEVPIAVIHNAERETFPWRGTVLAVHVARALSTLIGLASVVVTYYLARELCPSRRWLAWSAAALHAFLPMFLLLSASVSNDALATLLGNLLLLLLVKLLRGSRVADWRSYTLVGLVVGAGLLTKLSLGFGIVLVALTFAILDYRAYPQTRIPRHLLIGGVISGGVTIAVAGWWYARNAMLYGDVTGLNAFLAVVGQHDVTLMQLLADVDTLIRSTWGFVGAIYAPMPAIVYTVFNIIAVAGIAGTVAYAIQQRFRPFDAPIALCVLWLLITLVGLVRWSLMTPAMQGRLAFSALSVLAVGVAFGLGVWLPDRWRTAGLLNIGAYCVVVAAVAPFAVIAPPFAPPPALPADAISDQPQSTFRSEQGEITLRDARVMRDDVAPGETLDISLMWQVESPFVRDWSLFIHLVNPQGVIVAQRDLYPARNRMATGDLDTGRNWQTVVPVVVPETVYTPSDLSVRVGWYHQPTNQRMQRLDGSDSLVIGSVTIPRQTTASGIPNPVSVNFENQIELVGYDIGTLDLAPGESTELTLYWRGQAAIDRDYVVFANIIDPATLTKAADSNAMPANWERPTSTWEPDEIIEDVHTLTVYDDAKSGIYEIEIGLYLQEDGFPRLQVLDDGRPTTGFVHLTRVRIRQE